MRRFALGLVLLAGCHRAQSTPSPTPLGAEAAAPATAIQSADPSVLSESTETVSQIEPTIAVTPEGGVVIAWTKTQGDRGVPATLGVRFSPDGGTTWGPVQTVTSPEDRAASDPVLAADPNGNVYLAWLATGPNGPGNAPDSHVYLARAPAGTGSLEPAVELTDTMHRASKITTPSLAVTHGGAVVAMWAYTSSLGDGIGVARTADGLKWTKGVIIERIDLHPTLPYACASAHGERVRVAYLDSEAGVRVRASDDGGSTWSTSRVTTVSTPLERPLVAADTPVCAGDADDVTVAYGRLKEPTAAAIDAITIARSYDGGFTFDARRTLDSASSPMLHPELARETDGALDLAFYAGGAAPDAGALRWMRIADDKSPFGAPRLARDHFRFEPSPTGSAWPGNRFGWTWRDGTLYAASVDNSGELPHVAFTRIPSR